MVGDLAADGFLANAGELRAKIDADPALRARAVFTGYVSDDDLVALYNGAVALVLPSLLEGFGLPAVEAMACGTPVLASRVGSLPEVVGDAGLLFDPQSAEEMAAAIRSVVDDPGLRGDLARRASDRARRFTWERAADLAMRSLERACA
jgi:glycosyltransferase involved in cell wall biosynthesis